VESIKHLLKRSGEGYFHNDIGEILEDMHVALNEIKADFNGHGHTAVNQPPSSLVAASAVVALANEREINLSNEALNEVAGWFGAARTLINNIRTTYNTHEHTSATSATIAASQVTAADLVFNTIHEEMIGRQWPAMGHNMNWGGASNLTLGQVMTQITNLANDLKTKVNAHTHAGSIALTPNMSTSQADVASFY
jgi:hypothetical protein